MDLRNFVKVASNRKQQLSSISDLVILSNHIFAEGGGVGATFRRLPFPATAYDREMLPLLLEVATFQEFLPYLPRT